MFMFNTRLINYLLCAEDEAMINLNPLFYLLLTRFTVLQKNLKFTQFTILYIFKFKKMLDDTLHYLFFILIHLYMLIYMFVFNTRLIYMLLYPEDEAMININPVFHLLLTMYTVLQTNLKFTHFIILYVFEFQKMLDDTLHSLFWQRNS